MELKIGAQIKILEIMEFDGSREIEFNRSKNITISQQVSDNLLVIKK
jgi:hypothetical protein